MKKIIILIAVFTFTIGFSADAQVNTQKVKIAKKEQIMDNHDGMTKDLNRRKVMKRKRTKYRKNQKSSIKSMRKVAKADGVITLEEKLAMKAEKKRMRMKNKKMKNGKKLLKAEKRKVSRTMR